MKICIINNLFPPIASGGTEAVVQITLDVLRQAGHDVVLVTTHPDRHTRPWTADQSQGFPVYRFRPRNLYYYTNGAAQPILKKLLWHGWDMINPFDARTLQEILRLEKPDIVHGQNLKGMSYTLPNVCAQLSIPYFHTLHNYQLLHPYGTFFYRDHPPFFRPLVVAKLYQAINRRIFRGVTGVISPSVLPLKIHQQAGFFRQTPSAIIPSPIDTDVQPAQPKPHVELRIVYFGALEEHKGIRDLLEAVRLLPPNGWSLDIFGRGSLEHELRQISAGLDHVQWRGFVSDKSVLGQYDALVYPSRCYETQGLSMAEALIRGTPVIAADIGSIPETIQPGKNGWLYPAGNSAALAARLTEAMEHPERVRDLRSNARQSTARYSIGAFANSLLGFYHQATS